MRAAFAAVLLLLPFSAFGQTAIDSTEPTIDIQLFHLAPGGNNFLTTESGDVNSSFDLSLGMGLVYTKDPLKITLRNPDGTERDLGKVVQNRLDATLLVALGLFDIADIGIAMPFIYQAGFQGENFAGADLALEDQPKDFTPG